MTNTRNRPAHADRDQHRGGRVAAINSRRPADDEQPRTERWVQRTHDDDMEKILLGAFMADAARGDTITEHLTSSDFYREAHATVYRALVAAYALGDPTEPVAVADRLEADRALRDVGGIGFLRHCASLVPADVNAAYYAQAIAKKARLRAKVTATVSLQNALLRGDKDQARVYLDELNRISVEQADKTLTDMLVGGGQFVLDIPDTIPAVWGHGDDVLWAEGEALMICGPSGVGKTTLTGQLLRALLGLADKVLDWEVRPARRVLYLAMDRPAQIRRALSRVFTAGERPVLDERVVFWKGPPPYDVAARPETLLDMARAADADVVIVDSLKDAAIGLSEDSIGAGYNRARQAVLADDRQILELHHVVKRGNNGASPNTLGDVYGSAHLVNGAGSVIMLWGEAGDPVVEFKHLKQPMNDVGPFKVLHNGPAGTSQIFEGADLLDLARKCQTGGVTAADAAALVFEKDSPSKNQIEKARRRLLDLEKKGLLVQKAGARGGSAGSNAARWFIAAPSSWVPEGGFDAAA
ncbi:DnaB-like helicase N-terminal domain-containing protein [Dactylosporangium sucinum]|uniref:AAA+ ATPase domain-containing protein n=1 Tax=Dactylosporangium sucinum TaxID=1424081 RepID=A0A917U3Y0_9ACTN|nr:DnaB-like helicase N-terminal domain-containing protein [Dactylosporangium sucinum]GGM53583.1 hypothetical protein GCM10007977_063950 [Dactylosporangium sucinum]